MLAVLAVAATVYTGCEHRPQIRPAGLTIACGDANFYVSRLDFTRWAQAEADGTGVAYVNDCTPTCAAGHFRTYLVDIRLSKPVVCVRGRREFARIAWTYPRKKPAGPRAGAETFPCSFLRLKP